MNRIIKSTKGAISIFVALMMAGILSLGTFVIEAGRLQAAKTQLFEATISASSSMLSSYNLELHERYGLFAIDPTRSNETTCRSYLDFNSDLATGYFGNSVTRLYKIEDVTMTGIYNLTYPHILKRQLLTTAKYNITPEKSQLNMYTVKYALSDLQDRCQYVSSRMATLKEASGGNISSLDSGLVSALRVLDKKYATVKTFDEKQGVTLTNDTYTILPSVTGTVESEIPESDKNDVNAVANHANSLIGSDANSLAVQSSTVEESDVSINVDFMDTLRRYHDYSWSNALSMDEMVQIIYLNDLCDKYIALADSINAGINILTENSDGNLLLNSYISQKFSNRDRVIESYIGPGEESSIGDQQDMTFAKACCEYIFGGSVKETDNQSEAYDYIAAIRLIGNLQEVLSESTLLVEDNRYSVAAHMAWAYYETCMDMDILLELDTAVPLGKEKLILPINNPSKAVSALSLPTLADTMRDLGYYSESLDRLNIAGDDVFDYTDSLSLALWFVSNEDKLMKVADLIQLEMRYNERHNLGITPSFLMSEQNTYCRVECKAKMNSILPVISLGGEEYNLNDQTIKSVKYAGY